MTEPHVIFAAVSGRLAAIVALTLVALRLRRARRQFDQEVEAWKLRLRPRPPAVPGRNATCCSTPLMRRSCLSIKRRPHPVREPRGERTCSPGGPSSTARSRTCLPRAQRLAQPGPQVPRAPEKPAITPGGAPAAPAIDERPGDSAWVVDAARISETPDDAPEFRVVFRDVSAEHQAEQIRKDFVANASHELRTPLAIINGLPRKPPGRRPGQRSGSHQTVPQGDAEAHRADFPHRRGHAGDLEAWNPARPPHSSWSHSGSAPVSPMSWSGLSR